jgi:hypothetical protein
MGNARQSSPRGDTRLHLGSGLPPRANSMAGNWETFDSITYASNANSRLFVLRGGRVLSYLKVAAVSAAKIWTLAALSARF